MIKKYILFFIITGFIISIIGTANANTEKDNKNALKDLALYNSIIEKHDLKHEKFIKLLGDTYKCYDKNVNHKKNMMV